jgi:hypothetical protein
VLAPIDEWPERFIQCLGAWQEEIERPEQATLASLRPDRRR